MEPSFFLARFWGLLLVIIPLCYLVRKESLSRLLDSLSQPSAHLIYVIAGYLGIILGAGTIILHSYWSLNLGLLITLLGWGALISGGLHVIFADRLHGLAQHVRAQAMMPLRATLVVFLVLGVLLLLPF